MSDVGTPATSSPLRDLSDDDIRDEVEEEEDGEDLLGDDMLNDYRPIAALDTYDASALDNEGEYEEIDAASRQELEAQLRKRDREEMRRSGRVPAALLESDGEDDEEPARRRRRIAADDDDGVSSGASSPPREEYSGLSNEAAFSGSNLAEEEEGPFTNLDGFRGPLDEYLVGDVTRREIKRRFRQFLSDFNDGGENPVYPSRIRKMMEDNQQSMEISYLHLSAAVPILAIWVADEPSTMLELFDEEAMQVALTIFPEYGNVHREVRVRITQLPIVDSLRELRQVHLNALIKVVGVVTRRTSVFPQLKIVKMNCLKCGYVNGPYVQKDGEKLNTTTRCIECQSQGPFAVNMQETIYQNYQKITLQESPGSVPAGRMPRQKDVILLDDLIDTVSPGEEVEITGIYQHTFDAAVNFKQGFPVFTTMIKANYVQRKGQSLEDLKLTDDDIKRIIALSKKSNVAELIFKSIAPSIWGHENIKTGIALAMFGGEPKEMEAKHRIRGDINVLVLGDPGCAKSQFLKYVEHTAHRAVYTTGKGASAVGLTAAVRTDPVTREWTLEGGALVLADQGVCLIDEFDKMNDQDRTSIHEAMEQQSISISKAGIITTLKARCSVMAAANPTSGRYDSSTSFAENVDLSDAILSRFDCLCVVRDTVDPEKDRRLAGFVVDSHIKSHPNFEEDDVESTAQLPPPPVSQELLKKYIMYARVHCHPKLHNIDDDKIARLYAEMRAESMKSGGIPIAVRHVESIIRMSEAHAKIHLREYVIEDDVNMAIRVMLESFISSQKYQVMNTLRKHFSKYLSYKKENFELLLFTLNQMVKGVMDLNRLGGRREGSQAVVSIDTDEFEEKASELQISNLNPFYRSKLFSTEGYSLDSSKKHIIKNIDA